MKFMLNLTALLIALTAHQTLAIRAPSEFWMLDGLRFNLAATSRPATPEPAVVAPAPAGEPAVVAPAPSPETVEPAPAAGATAEPGAKKKRKTPSPQAARQTPSPVEALANGYDLAPDSAERKLIYELGIPVGDAPYVAEWQKGFSPLMGALAWHNGIIHNLFFYGPKDDPFIKFVQLIFNAAPESRELNVTQKNSGAFRTIVQLPAFGQLVRMLLIGAELTANSANAIAPSPTYKANQRKNIVRTFEELQTSLAAARTSPIFPPEFIALVLSAAWYRLVQSSDLAIEQNPALARDTTQAGQDIGALKTLIDGFVAQSDASDRLSALKKALKTWKSDEDKIIATFAWSFFSPYPPEIAQSWHMICKVNKSLDYPDCGENTLHNLFDFLVFDPLDAKTYQFDKYLVVNGLKPHQDLQKFYKAHAAVNTSADKGVCQEWADLVSGIEGVHYSLLDTCDLSPSPDMVLKVVGRLLGIRDIKKEGAETTKGTSTQPAASGKPGEAKAEEKKETKKLETWNDLEKLLSTSTRTIQIGLDADGNTTLTIDEAGLERTISLHMTAEHAEAHFPQAVASLSDNIKGAITAPLARLLLNLDPLSGNIQIAQAHIYAQPLTGMDDFDAAVSTVLEKAPATPSLAGYAESWLQATITKWLEMPDNAPQKIIAFVWQQIRGNGTLAGAAHKFLAAVDANKQLHKAYTETLSADFKKNNRTLTWAQSDPVWKQANETWADLSPFYLHFLATGSDEEVRKAAAYLTSAWTKNPDTLFELKGQIAALIKKESSSIDERLEKHFLPILKGLAANLTVSAPAIAFFTKLETATYKNENLTGLHNLAIDWFAPLFDKEALEATPKTIELAEDIIKTRPELGNTIYKWAASNTGKIIELQQTGELSAASDLSSFTSSELVANNFLAEMRKSDVNRQTTLRLTSDIIKKHPATREAVYAWLAAQANTIWELLKSGTIEQHNLLDFLSSDLFANNLLAEIFKAGVDSNVLQLAKLIVEKNPKTRETLDKWLAPHADAILALFKRRAITPKELQPLLASKPSADSLVAAIFKPGIDGKTLQLAKVIIPINPATREAVYAWLAAHANTTLELLKNGTVTQDDLLELLSSDLFANNLLAEIFKTGVDGKALKLAKPIVEKNPKARTTTHKLLTPHIKTLVTLLQKKEITVSDLSKFFSPDLAIDDLLLELQKLPVSPELLRLANAIARLRESSKDLTAFVKSIAPQIIDLLQSGNVSFADLRDLVTGEQLFTLLDETVKRNLTPGLLKVINNNFAWLQINFSVGIEKQLKDWVYTHASEIIDLAKDNVRLISNLGMIRDIKRYLLKAIPQPTPAELSKLKTYLTEEI